jgi:hypothetical protein
MHAFGWTSQSKAHQKLTNSTLITTYIVELETLILLGGNIQPNPVPLTHILKNLPKNTHKDKTILHAKHPALKALGNIMYNTLYHRHGRMGPSWATSSYVCDAHGVPKVLGLCEGPMAWQNKDVVIHVKGHLKPLCVHLGKRWHLLDPHMPTYVHISYHLDAFCRSL